ncbi:MAG: dihydropteroate synthase [Armatimonadota bacterium]|nr:dihydropteroate synthase [Armatimonadota bacterium]
MDHRPRVLDLRSASSLHHEMQAIGVDAAATEWLADRGRFRPVRLEGVAGPAAALLKQEMLALGGDCAVHRGVARFEADPRPVVLLGDAGTYERLAERLRQQPFGLSEVGQEVLAAVRGFDAEELQPLQCGKRTLPLRRRTVVMGILNVTPDSFSGDGLGGDAEATMRQAEGFVEAGADILDVGGESTRPGAEPVSVEEELERVLPVVEALAERFDCVVSIDTSKPEVARLAVAAGAGMINDVFGLRADGMAEAVADTGAAACIMHMQGEPRNMQENPHYDDLMTEIYDFLAARAEAAVEAGVRRSQLVVDPGFGFGKTVGHNLEMLRRLRELRSLGLGVLIGTSRKSTIGKVLDLPAEERLMGTAATCAIAIANGADIIRVHDVAEMAQVAAMSDAIMRGWAGE